MDDMTIYFHLGPIALICLIGIAVLIRYMSKQRVVCSLAIAGLSVRLALLASWVFYTRWLQSAFIDNSDRQAVEQMMARINMIRTAAGACSLFLLVAAVVVALRTIGAQLEAEQDIEFDEAL